MNLKKQTLKLLGSIKSNHGLLRYSKNTAWGFLQKASSLFLGLFVGVWVARYLGPEKFGILNYAQALVGTVTAIAALGLNNIVIRELVKHKEDRNIILGSAFFLKIFGSIVAISILLLILLFTQNTSLINILVIIISFTLIIQSFNVIDFYFQGEVKLKYTSIANIFMLIISSAVKVALILLRAPLIYFAISLLLDSIVLSFFFIIFYIKNKLSIFNWRFSCKQAIYLLKNSWPLILSSMAIMVYMKIDQIMIKNMINAKELGIYSAAVRISELWYFIPTIITQAVFPAIINSKKVSEHYYLKRLTQLTSFLVWFAVIAAVVMTFLSGFIINILYGNQYILSAKVLCIHIWTGIFVSLGVSSSSWFIIENLQKMVFIRNLSGAIINILLNFILIPTLGIIGAAIATVISQFFACFMVNLFNKKTRKIFFIQCKAFILKL